MRRWKCSSTDAVMPKEISKVPYLIDAMRNWAMDSGHTPHLTIEAAYPGVNLPFEKIECQNGLITLNIHDRALRGYEVSDGWILFETRFSGKSHRVDLPIESVISLVVPEVMNQMVFREYSLESAGEEHASKNPEPPSEKSKPHLRLVE